MDPDNITIEKVHGTEKMKEEDGTVNKKRKVVVKFLNYKEGKRCDKMQKKQVWNQGIFVNENFSQEPINVQKQLFPRGKVLREQGSYVKVIHDKVIFIKKKKGEISLRGEITTS